MAIHVALNHVTTYKYARPVSLGPQIVRLRPAPHSRTPVLSYSLKINPQDHFINWQQDPQGNYLARLVFPEKSDLFQVQVDLTADMTIINPFDFFLEEYAEDFPFKYEPWLMKELKPFMERTKQPEIFNDFVKSVRNNKRRTIDFLVEVNQRIQNEIGYLIRLEPGVQTPEETLTKRSGSCRDSAWLMVNFLRHKGLAARFVSGYLIQLTADVKSLDGPSGTDKDFTDLHAWAEVYLPGAGWVGLDPTSGLMTGEGHIPLVATPEPSSAAPISGAVEACEVEFGHTMNITRIHEDPRVTKPYTEEQWEDIYTTGQEVDDQLRQEKVKLTMGGEPTFVSIDDMEGEQWTTGALGQEKRELSVQLFYRLKELWTSGALVHTGLGKWYPGEQLPRWVLACYWRKDCEPIWQDAELLAADGKDYGYTVKDARKFMKTLAGKLDVESKNIVPGYEDAWYYLWKEQKLPVNVDPLKSNLKDPLERKRLSQVFSRDIGEVVGYALPLACESDSDGVLWYSRPWKFRGGHMYLIQGDSPMGLRLPLDTLPWSAQEDLQKVIERDPLLQLDPLTASRKDGAKKALRKPGPLTVIRKGKSAQGIVRTALCVQARDGRLHVFMPPVSKGEEYLDLIGYVEQAARELKMPVVIEGYHPPFDPRILNFKITPDPGVIEVNVAPVKTWAELVDQITGLYEEARLSRLGTEKFMLDGKHSGTGGGNHVVLGGETPKDSPFLRRPDVLASLVSYWHNHPALSYLFSGTFIGPTSQAPRVDEGRRDSLYELEIALREVQKQQDKSGHCPPWITDRLFRHILVDGTGNTHRAEFCIDKLYSPDSATGRLGLVEFRSFEMPPHARMSLVQQLLIRALILKMWKEPYRQELVRWDTILHDRFLLPHFVREDFNDILADLNDFGVGLKIEHFEPHFEFRFPVVGTVNHRGIHLELKSAIEPWYVLGEEPAGGGTSRFVDSSVERMQIKVRGVADKRYQICCNGFVIPLHCTGTQGEYVAGIRYRAWQPPSCLHPTIPVHTPLTFDIVDTWSKRSVGGCVYHVAHPGGRNYDTFPVNAYEAESRRMARFFKVGHTPGKMQTDPVEVVNPDYPLTLDLRRVA